MTYIMPITKLTSEEIRLHKGISFTGITTVFLCHDGKGNLFLTKRSSKTRDEHRRWDPGGGGLKHGQSVEETVLRELKEEYDVVPLELDFIGYFDAFRTIPDGTPTHWLAMCFAARINPVEINLNEPEMVDDYGWFTLDNLPKPMHSQFDIFMEKHGQRVREIIEKQ